MDKIDETLGRKSMDFSAIGENSIRAALDESSLGRFSVDKARVQRALEAKDIATLRQFSQYFYHNSGEYRRLVDYFGNILTNDFVVVPTDPKVSTANMKKFQKILDYAEQSNIKDTCNSIGQILVRDGAFYGYERDLDGVLTIQHLPTAFCRSKFKVYGVYAVEFDFGYFDAFRGLALEDILKAFPEGFDKMYQAYLKDRQNERWQLLDPLFARAHMLEDPVPMLSPVFLDLIELEDYKRLEKRKAKLDLYKIIVQKIPLNSDKELTFTMDELKQFHSNMRKLVRDTEIDVVTTPCDVESVDLQDTVQTDRQLIERATSMIYTTSGTPMMLFSSTAKSGSIGLRESIRVDENTMLPLLQQYERWYQNKFESIANIQCKVIFPPITQFNRKEMVDLYTAGAASGFPTKLLTMAAMGVTQHAMNALLVYENDVLLLHERMIPTSSSHTQSGSEEENEGGRPESDQPLTDEGDATREGNKNANRAGGK